MKGIIKKFNKLDELIKEIPLNKGFTLLLEDWDNGFKLEKIQVDENLINRINELKERYNSFFSFRIFNQEIDISWNGEEGIVAEVYNNDIIDNNENYDIEEIEIYLEKDYNKFPGIKSLTDYNKAKVEIFKRNGNTIYIKLKEFLCVNENVL